MRTNCIIPTAAALLALCLSSSLCKAQDGTSGLQSPRVTGSQAPPPDLPVLALPAHEPVRIFFLPLTASGHAVKAAEALFNEGKYREAFDMCRTAQQMVLTEGKNASYDSMGLQCTIGFTLVELGDDTEALKCMLPIFKHLSGGDLNWYTAIALARTGDVVGAAKLCDATFDIFPDALKHLWNAPIQSSPATELTIRAWHQLGDESMNQMNFKAALSHFKAAQELDSHSTLIAYDLGRAYSELHQYRDAAAEFAWAAKSSYPDLKAEAKKELLRVKDLQKLQPTKPPQQ